MGRQFFFGSFLISLSASVMATSIFQYDTTGTAAGILGFPIGYTVLRSNDFPFRREVFDSKKSLYAAGMLIGSLITAKGLVVAAQATETLRIAPMIYSGVIMMTGLVLTHELYVRGFLK